jgi:hypothetical protein
MQGQEIFDQLSAPFPEHAIDWRVGSTNKDKTKGMALAYIDARAVQDRFDSVCGMDGWQCNYTPIGDGSVVCNIGVRSEGDWIWKSNGAGKTDFEAEKGMYSDAFKRAAVMFGVGRYLYDLQSPWVALKDGRYIEEAEQKKLTALHEDFAQKAGWGIRAGIQPYRLLKKVVLTCVTDAAAAQQFKEDNKGEIALLPVAMRQHLFTLLDRVGGAQSEAA